MLAAAHMTMPVECVLTWKALSADSVNAPLKSVWYFCSDGGISGNGDEHFRRAHASHHETDMLASPGALVCIPGSLNYCRTRRLGSSTDPRPT